MKKIARHRMPLASLAFLLASTVLLGQSDNGELRVTIHDNAGLAVPGEIQLVSQSNDYRQTLRAGDEGAVTFKRLPHGLYTVQVSQPGFAPISRRVEITSQLPLHLKIVLEIAPLNTSVNVVVAE